MVNPEFRHIYNFYNYDYSNLIKLQEECKDEAMFKSELKKRKWITLNNLTEDLEEKISKTFFKERCLFSENEKKEDDTMFRREQNSNYSSKVRMNEKPILLEEKNNNHYHKQESQFFVTDEAVNKKEERKYKCDGVLINGNYYTNEQLLKLNLSEKENNNIQNKFQKKTQTGYLVKGYFYTPEEFYLMIDKGICKEIDGQKTNRTVETPVEFQEMYIWKDNYYTSEEIDHLIEKNIITLDEVNKGFEKGVKIIPKNKQIKKGEDISMIALESRERTFEDARKQKYMQDRKRRREHEANIANIELSEKIALQKLQDKRNKGCML